MKVDIDFNKYQRINVIGCPGAGKSTLSKKLSELSNYPLFDLDMFLYDTNCKRLSKGETKKTINELFVHKCFIIDGTYTSTFEDRLNNIDGVILVDTKTWLCLYRFLNRLWTNNKLKCGERLTLKTAVLILKFNIVNRKRLIQTAKKYNKLIHIFRQGDFL